MGQPITVSAENFVSEVVEHQGIVLVDFWGQGCGPCRMLAPILDQIAAENDAVKVAKIDVYESAEIANHYGVMSIPTVLVFKNGEVVDQMVGAQSKAKLEEVLREQA